MENESRANSQIHQKALVAQQTLASPLDSPLNKCCWRWLNQKPRTAAAQLRPALSWTIKIQLMRTFWYSCSAFQL